MCQEITNIKNAAYQGQTEKKNLSNILCMLRKNEPKLYQSLSKLTIGDLENLNIKSNKLGVEFYSLFKVFTNKNYFIIYFFNYF